MTQFILYSWHIIEEVYISLPILGVNTLIVAELSTYHTFCVAIPAQLHNNATASKRLLCDSFGQCDLLIKLDGNCIRVSITFVLIAVQCYAHCKWTDYGLGLKDLDVST